MNLAGPLKVLSDGGFKAKYGALFMTPAETRAEFERLGWSKVAAFQTRNPMHRSHEYLAKVAIEVCDGVLVHSLLGAVKPGDIPAEVRTRDDRGADRALLREEHRRAGGLSARHALRRPARSAAARRSSARTTAARIQIVGRDHAGVGSYYGPFDAHHIFDEIPPGSLETQPLKLGVTFWCYRCGGMASGRTCPHSESGPAAGVRHPASQVALGRRRGARRLQPARGARDPARVLRVARLRLGPRRLRTEGNLRRFPSVTSLPRPNSKMRPYSSMPSITYDRLLPCASCASEIVTPPPSAFSMTKLSALSFGSS